MVVPSELFKSQISIKIFEKFDNSDFGLQSLEFLLSNDHLQINESILRVRTTLFGIRWYMQEWFYTVFLVFVGTTTAISCSSVFMLVIVIKRTGWL